MLYRRKSHCQSDSRRFAIPSMYSSDWQVVWKSNYRHMCSITRWRSSKVNTFRLNCNFVQRVT